MPPDRILLRKNFLKGDAWCTGRSKEDTKHFIQYLMDLTDHRTSTEQVFDRNIFCVNHYLLCTNIIFIELLYPTFCSKHSLYNVSSLLLCRTVFSVLDTPSKHFVTLN